MKQLLEDRADKQTELEEVVSRGRQRHLTAEEKDRIYRLEKELTEIDEELKPLRAEENRMKRKIGMNNLQDTIDEEFDETPSSEIAFFKKGVQIARTPIVDHVRANKQIAPEEQVSVWKVLPALLGKKTKDRKVLDAVAGIRALSGNANVLNDYLSGQILDAALPKSRLIQAGMKVIPLLSGTHRFGKIGTIPDLEWKNELDSTTERTASIDSVEFTARTLRGWVQCSSEFLQDGVNAEEIIRRLLTTAVAQGIDSAGLTGSGTPPVPLGLLNNTDIPKFNVGSLTSYDDLIVGQRLIWENDGDDATAVILSPNAMAQYAALKGTVEGQTINPPALLGDLKFLQTSKLSGASTSDAVMGNFNSLVLGVRLEATLYISPVISETYAHKFLIAFRGDVQCARAEDFAILEDIGNNDLT